MNIMAAIAGHVDYALLSRNGGKIARLRALAFTVNYEKAFDETGYTECTAYICDQMGFIVALGKGINRSRAFDVAYKKWLEKREINYQTKENGNG